MRPLPPFARRFSSIAALATLALAACDRAPEPPPAPTVHAPETAAAPPTPLQPVVDRAELLRALDAAASAFAAGQPDNGAALDGRRYSVRQPFGCAGPALAGVARPAGLASWTWGPRNQTIELNLQPADWTGDLGAGDGDAPEAIEGFWLARPWMRADGCPAATLIPPASPPEDAAPTKAGTTRPPPQRETAGLASVFAQGGSRVGRRDGRAFTHTLRGEDGPPPAPTAGFRLVIEGRFTAFPGGQTVRCRAGGQDERPVCIAASTIDRVVFETADGQQLSEWRPGV